jgi:hypothetical protein
VEDKEVPLADSLTIHPVSKASKRNRKSEGPRGATKRTKKTYKARKSATSNATAGLLETGVLASSQGSSNESVDADDSADDLTQPVSRIVTGGMVALLATTIIEVEQDAPTYKEAMAGKNRGQFLEAISKEYASLKENGVFSEPCLLPERFSAIGTKMVLKVKESKSAEVPRKFKARLCGLGYRQEAGVNYFDTFAPVATYSSIRLLTIICATLDLEMDTVDVTTAFLLAPLKEDIYINIPDGYPNSNDSNLGGKVIKLQKSLYGLKQAPHDWNQEINGYLLSIGFKPTISDPCFYVGTVNGVKCYLLLYVDDMVIATKDRTNMQQLKKTINAKFPIVDNGPIEFFLNMHFVRDWKTHTIAIHQTPRIKRLMQDSRFSREDVEYMERSIKIPAKSDVMLTREMCPVEPQEKADMVDVPYKSILGIILYIAITARPDLATAICS